MNLIFKLFMFLLFFIAGGALLLNYIKYFVIYNKFRDYLFSIDDKDTLRKIGRLNSLDQRTFANVPFTKVHKVLIEKYKQTNDEKYLLFDEQYMKCIKHIAILIASLFMIYVFYQILSYG